MNVQSMSDSKVFATYNSFASTPQLRIYVCVFMYVSAFCIEVINKFVDNFNFKGYSVFVVGGSLIFASLCLINFSRYGIGFCFNFCACRENLMKIVEARCEKNEKMNTPLKETFFNLETLLMVLPIFYIAINWTLFAILIVLILALEAAVLKFFCVEYMEKVVSFARNLTEFEKSVENEELIDECVDELAEDIFSLAKSAVKSIGNFAKNNDEILND